MAHTHVTQTNVWDTVRAELRRLYPADIFGTWFSPVQATVDGKGRWCLEAPNEFAAIWLEDNYREILQEKFAQVLGEPVELLIAASATEAAPEVSAPVKAATNRLQGVEPQRPARHRLDDSAEELNRTALNPRYTFENFIVGPSNQLAHAACTAVAAEPGKSYNPLFIYGDTGLGKTHLMHAVAHTIRQRDPESRVVYLSCEKFTNQFLGAIQKNALEAFRRTFRKVDVLLIDDIQFLEGKERTQEEFFHTFNELFESGHQICLSSDRPASEIQKLESRLVSRFQWGMVTDVQIPDLETRVAILRKKAEAQGNHHLPGEVLQFLASRITRNVRRMEGALVKVAAYHKLKHHMDVATAERLIADILAEETEQQITMEKIQHVVVEYYDLRPSDMVSKRRPSNIAFPRQVAMYLCRILTAHPLKEIGEAFGGRDHGTVIHAIKTVENMIEQDPGVKKDVEHLKVRIANT